MKKHNYFVKLAALALALVLTVPHTAVAAIMQEAHWLVSEGRYINKFYIEGFKRNEEIYIKYSDVPIDFRTRKWEGSVSE